jgi:acetyl-CoA decarbonylase/synthase complex subunit gamma
MDKYFITGKVSTQAGSVPQVSTRLIWRDCLGAFRVRWGFKRNHYRVDPGLYAIGIPDERSDVLVSANYKLSFDILRKNLKGMNAWLLVLDTKGVNIWCAAGKGTFGTEGLVGRIKSTNLDKIVNRKRIIIPQLGAVGVAAHLVKEYSGFTVIYGPVRASDIHDFIHANYKATKEMRLVSFGWYDRIKLILNDFIQDLRYLGILLTLSFILSGINTDGFSVKQAVSYTLSIAKLIGAGYFAGVVLTPLFLPYIPTRNFSFKGLIMGAIVSVLLYLYHALGNNLLIIFAGFFLISGFASFLAMNFTGASTYTSLAGIKKEMRIAVPVQIAFASFAAILFILNGVIL